MKVPNTFDKAMDPINNLQKVFRDEGMLAKAVVDPWRQSRLWCYTGSI